MTSQILLTFIDFDSLFRSVFDLKSLIFTLELDKILRNGKRQSS